MRKNVSLAWLVVIFASLIIFAGCKKKEFFIATGGTTGTYYAFGSAVASLLSEETGIPLFVQISGASKANIQLINAGNVEFAIVQNDVMDYAWRGVDLFNGEKTNSFSCMAALYAEVCQVVASAESGITGIDGLRGKNVSVGDAGSGVEFNARQILEIYGITFNDIDMHNLSFGSSADALVENKIDAFFCIAGTPTPAIADLAAAKEIVILEIDLAAELIKKYPFYSRHRLPAGSYRNQADDITTVAVKAALIASNSVPEDMVYTLTKALFENKARIEAAHPKGKELSTAYAVEGISVPFHPGSVKYYREIGAFF